MSERGQPSERLQQDPVRVVYHAGNRQFARLFNERSLDEVKNVVRRKLGLGRETDVSLKQMGPDALLDLEDDDDFQAFRVLLKSSVSVDIQVTVGVSRGSTVPPPVAPQVQEQPSVNEPTTISSASHSTPLTRSVLSGESSAHPEVAPTTQTSATAVKTPGPSARKRKVSFDDAALATPDKPAGRRVRKVTVVTAVAPAETAESPAAPEPIAAEEPPKKKQKKEITKAKDVQPTEAIQSAPTKVSDAPKPKPRKSMALDRESEAGTSAPKDAVTSEPLTKEPKRRKKDDGAGLKKSSAPVDREGMDQLIDPSNDPVDEVSLQPASEKPKRTSVGARKSEKAKAPRGTACAAIPRTSASTTVQSEVAAAILSGYLSKTSETVPPEPPAKRKPVKKDTKNSSAYSIALPVESTTVSGAPANEVPNVSTERRLEHVVLTNGPPQRTQLNSPPCPICLEEPFHIRYCCPTVLKGPDAIRERLEELKRTNAGDRQSLIKELEGLLRDSKVTSKPSLDAAPIDGLQSRVALPPPNASIPRTPTIPSNSYVSEVTVESRGEGSSSESSDDISEGGVERKELPAPRGQQTLDEQPSAALHDLEAVIRGPASRRQSVLNFIDRIVGDKDDEDSGSEEDSDEAELEEDSDEEINRSGGRLSRRIKRASDSESEDEESGSPSPSRSAEGISNNLQSGVQGPNKPAEESAKHQDDDVVMRDSVDPPVLEGQDDGSSEETHVGSEDRMDVDRGPVGEKRAATIVEQHSLSHAPRASVLPPSDAPSKEPQEPSVEPTFNRDGDVPVASEVHDEVEVEADPIEPADDLEPPAISHSSDADPIEAPSEDIGSFFTGATQSIPKPGVTKRIKTRNGQIPNDEAERPVLLEQLATEAAQEVTPLAAKGKSRRKTTEMSAAQEAAPTRKSPRFSSLPPSTSTPAAAVLLKHKSKVGARIGNAAKTPAKRSGERLDALPKDDAAQNGARIAPTPSVNRWETLAEPSSPSLQLDEPSVRIDELMSSSPQPDDIPKGRSRKLAAPSQTENSQRKVRLFDLSSSQIPFPYSQHQNNPVPTALSNGKEREETTDSDSGSEPKVSKKKAKLPVRYRSLSHLASQATKLFSPSLPTPANKSVTGGKTRKRVADENSSSSSSSSDVEGVTGSGHIPQGRRAGSVLETRQKRKSLLSRS